MDGHGSKKRNMFVKNENVFEREEEEEEEEHELIIAGPTAPLENKRVKTLIPCKFDEEHLDLVCEWFECTFSSESIYVFMDHVSSHIPILEVAYDEDKKPVVLLNCQWNTCPWKTDKKAKDLQRHLFLHAYHTKLKCIGTNTRIRIGNISPCKADSGKRNLLPDLADNLICAWGSCTEDFINIQSYYDHIRLHCESEDHPRGRNVPGGIRCLWAGCSTSFCNITKLRDHVRSHSQEKLLACPTCGGLFSNRTRLFDHCRRQVADSNKNFACNVCIKCFSSARLLRDHVRSHTNSYQCSSCDMSCSSISALNSHKRYKHSSLRKYLCPSPNCTYAAKSHSDLTRHQKIHNAPLYKCEEEGCNFETRSLLSLNNHWDHAHGEQNTKKYSCHVCNRIFSRGFYLSKHLSKVHKLQWPSGNSRFRYKPGPDGLWRLLTVRYESIEIEGGAEIEDDQVDHEEEGVETTEPMETFEEAQETHQDKKVMTFEISPIKLEPSYTRHETEISIENY